MSDQDNLSQLFQGSGLQEDAVSGLTGLSADTLGPAIAAGLGAVSIEDVSTEVVLVVRDIDDSSSIEFEGNTQIVIDGENDMIEALRGSNAAGTILVATVFFNGGLVQPFVPLDQVLMLNNSNYHPSGGTPMYDSFSVCLGMMVAKSTELQNGGVAVRGVTRITTDGDDTGSRQRAHHVEPIVHGMLRTESHIVSGMGIADGRTDFRQVFRDMGIAKRWILTPANTPSEVRAAYATVSRSVVNASQTAGDFSQTALGGFGGTN